VRSPRNAERDAFLRVTDALEKGQAVRNARFSQYASALHDNQRLWTVLGADVADPENGLPVELRARVFYLSDFTRNHTRKALRGEADAAALIEINRAMIAGLASRGDTP
jgi:flagellar protein FlaF